MVLDYVASHIGGFGLDASSHFGTRAFVAHGKAKPPFGCARDHNAVAHWRSRGDPSDVADCWCVMDAARFSNQCFRGRLFLSHWHLG